jgi:hypothetical protein
MKTRFVLALMLSFAVAGVLGAADKNERATVTPSPMNAAQVYTPTLLAATKSRLYVFDERTNRLAVIERNSQKVTLTGEIGTGRGQFFHPAAMAASEQGIVLFDILGNRVQFLSAEGVFQTECQLSEPTSSRTVALTAAGLVLVNTPSSDHVITAYDRQCRKQSSFGPPATLSELYSPALAARNRDYKFAANRLWLAGDKSGNTYAAYLLAPVLTKYDKSGNLLWTRKFDQAREEQFRQYVPKNGGMSTGVDGVQVPYMTKAVFSEEDGKVLVLCSVDLFRKDRLFEFSSNGDLLSYSDIEVPRGSLFKMALQDHDLVLSALFAPALYHANRTGKQN